MEEDVELSKYIKRLSQVSFLLLIVLGAALNLLDINGNSGFNNLIGDVSLDNLIILGIVALVISPIYFAGIYFSYGSFANSYFKALQKKSKR